MIDKDRMLLIEYEIERVINKQLYHEKHITYEIYEKVNRMIMRDLEQQTRKVERMDAGV